MNLFFNLLTAGIVGSAVFTALLLLRLIIGKHFSKTWQYYSLLVPLVFLLGGTTFSNVWNVPLFLAPQEMTMNANSEFFNLPLDDSFTSTLYANSELIADAVISSSIATWLAAYFEKIVTFLMIIWALGVVLYLTVSTKKYLQYRRLVFCNATRITDIDCRLPVFISKVAHTPMLIGLMRPKIILPSMSLTNEALEMILAHEMVHYKRKDLFVKLLMLITNAVHWFNPIVYALSKQLNMMCELSCDEKVVFEMDAKNRRAYGETILHVLSNSTAQKSLIGNVAFATNLCNSKKNYKRRLINMMNAKKMRKSTAALALAVGMFVIGGGFVLSNILGLNMPVVYAAEATQATETYESSYNVVQVSAKELQAVQALWDAHDERAAEMASMGGALIESMPVFSSWTRAELIAAISRIAVHLELTNMEVRILEMTPDELIARKTAGIMIIRSDESTVDTTHGAFFAWVREHYTEENIAAYEEMGAPQWLLDRLWAEISAR